MARRHFGALPCLFTVAALLLTRSALAAEWRLKLSMNMSESYSDNIRLAPRGSERGDWVTQATPGLALTATGPRLKLTAQYQMQNQFYAANNQQNSTRHQLNADAHSTLINNQLFLDGRATLGQQNISPLGAQAVNNINITSNRADVMTLVISPYLRHRFRELSNAEVRYTHSLVNTTAAGLANSQTQQLALKLDSGDTFRILAWGVDYNRQQSLYSNYLLPINNESYTANLSYLITPRFALTATAGHEKSDYIAIGTPPAGSVYSAGFSWKPSMRTTLEASAGHRYFGSNYMLNAKHRSRRTTWSMSYSEDITTTQAQFLANTGTQTLPGPVNLLSNQVFLQKRLQTSMTIEGRRNQLMFTLFDATRDAQTAQAQNIALLGLTNQTLANNSRQLGGNAFWSSKISPHTTTDLNTGYVRTLFPSLAATTYDMNIQLGITTQLQPKLSSLLQLRHNQHNSSLLVGDYRENAFMASLLMQF